MLRVLVALLLVANLGFLALSRGWLAPAFKMSTPGEREPQRLAAQIDAQSIEVLTPAAASAALQHAATVCLQSGPLKAGQLAEIEAAITQAGLGSAALTRVPLPEAAQWLVVLARPDDAAADQRLQERLRSAGFAPEAREAREAQAAQPRQLVLSRHGTREAAAAALAEAQLLGVAGAKVVTAAAATVYALRVAPVDAALRERLQALPDAGFVQCNG